MKAGVVVFPGSNCDRDTYRALSEVSGFDVKYLWHEDTELSGFEFIVLPGGFSYGDYLRTGAFARFSPIMRAVADFAENGGYVLGICNGFQILLEAGILPGIMLANRSLRFICDWTYIRTEHGNAPFTASIDEGTVLKIPIAHFEGNYFAEEDKFAQIDAGNNVLFRYCDKFGNVVPDANPNGSLGNIAGITNDAGNVLGMMPHPERANEVILGSSDGRKIFESIIQWRN